MDKHFTKIAIGILIITSVIFLGLSYQNYKANEYLGVASLVNTDTGSTSLLKLNNLITAHNSLEATTSMAQLNAGTATALAANPTDCSANQFANTIAANGNLTCSALVDADIPDTITASNYLTLANAYATTTMSQLTTLANVTDIGTIAKLDFTLASGTQATIGTNFYIDSTGKVTQTYASGTAATFTNFYGALTGTASGNLTSSSIDTIAEINANLPGEDVASTTWAGASSLITLGTVTSGTWNATPLTAIYGGTGLTAGGLKAGSIPYGAGASAFATSSDLQFSGSTLTVTYASTTALTSTNFYGNWAGDTIGVTKGGTGLTAIAAGGLLYASSSNYMAVLASSTAGSVLTINSSGFPAWSIPYLYPAFSIASTTWNGIAGLTASSTIVLKPLYTNETWSGFRCYTDTGTALIKIGSSSAYSTAVTASSTANEIGYAKSYLAGEIMQAVISNISATTNWVACTIKKVNY